MGEKLAATTEAILAQGLLAAGDQFQGSLDRGGATEGAGSLRQSGAEDFEVVFLTEVFLQRVEGVEDGSDAGGLGGADEGDLVEEGLGGGAPGVEAGFLAGGSGGFGAAAGTPIAGAEPGF